MEHGQVSWDDRVARQKRVKVLHMLYCELKTVCLVCAGQVL